MPQKSTFTVSPSVACSPLSSHSTPRIPSITSASSVSRGSPVPYLKPERPVLMPIDTRVVSRISTDERIVLKIILESAFDPLLLLDLLFYRALITNRPLLSTLTSSYYDAELSSYINAYPDGATRSTILHVFRRLSRGKFICASPREVSLKTLVPHVSQDELSTKLVDGISAKRLDQVHVHFYTLDSTNMTTHPRLSNPVNYKMLYNTLTEVNDQHNALLAFDFEAYELDSTAITEIGIAIYDPLTQAATKFPTFKNIHILIEENLSLLNTRFTKDHRSKFLYGRSLVLHMETASELIQCLIDYFFLRRESQFLSAVLVSHNVSSTLSHLDNMSIYLPPDMRTVDTHELFHLSDPGTHASLGSMLTAFDIPHCLLDNAGNDAQFTMELCLMLCDPLFRTAYSLDVPGGGMVYEKRLREYEKDEMHLDEEAEWRGKRPKRFKWWEEALEFVYSEGY